MGFCFKYEYNNHATDVQTGEKAIVHSKTHSERQEEKDQCLQYVKGQYCESDKLSS